MCRSRARLRRHRKTLLMMSGHDADLPPPSTIATSYQHRQHQHLHPMTSSKSGYPTLTSAIDPEFEIDRGARCCLAPSASIVGRHPLPVPVYDCACANDRFRPRQVDNPADKLRSATGSPDRRRRNSSSFKDPAAASAGHILRMSDAILLPVADGAVNCGPENTVTNLGTVVDVCRLCSAESLTA